MKKIKTKLADNKSYTTANKQKFNLDSIVLTLGFIFEVLLFFFSGYLFAKGEPITGTIFLLLGFLMAYYVARLIQKEVGGY